MVEDGNEQALAKAAGAEEKEVRFAHFFNLLDIVGAVYEMVAFIHQFGKIADPVWKSDTVFHGRKVGIFLKMETLATTKNGT